LKAHHTKQRENREGKGQRAGGVESGKLGEMAPKADVDAVRVG
jgi:hypothetical protein